MKNITIVEDGFGFIKNPEKGMSDIVRRFTITNKNDVQVQVVSYGATITSVKCPDFKGRIHDVVLGFDELEGYLKNQPAYFGSVLGRVANRVANGRFRLGGRDYEVSKNAGEFQLHGGVKGFDQVVWNSYVKNDHVVFTYLSKDGEEGYPGDVMVQITYSLNEDNDLKMEIQAISSKPTPVNLTNHAYFNLAGHCAGSRALYDHYVTINADKVLSVTDDLIPTGEIRKVGGTIYDLRTPRKLGEVIPLVPGGGYDNTMCINGSKEDGVRFVARIHHPPSGRVLEVFSDQPSIQWYTSRNLPEPEATPSKETTPVPSSQLPVYSSEMPVLSSQQASPRGSRDLPSQQPTPLASRDILTTSQQPTPVGSSQIPGLFSSKQPTPMGSQDFQSMPSSKQATPMASQEFQSMPSSKQATPMASREFQSMPSSRQTTPMASKDAISSSQQGSPMASKDIISSTKGSPMASGDIPVPSQQASSELPVEGEITQEQLELQLIPPMVIGKDHSKYHKYGAFCVETQNYPDAVNHSRFPDSILRPGEVYRHTCIYRFNIQK